MKKNNPFLIIFFILLLVITSYSALAGGYMECSVQPKDSCFASLGSVKVLYLTNFSGGYDNAHAQLPNVSIDFRYDNVVCCTPLGVPDALLLTCDGGTEIARISNETNAHIQQPQFDNYNHTICIKPTINDFTCEYDVTCSSSTTCLFSMSNETNAHIGSCSEYPHQVCCGVVLSGTGVTGGGGDDGGSCQPGYHTNELGYCVLDEKPTVTQYSENVQQSVDNFLDLKWVSSILDFLKSNMIIAASLGIILLVFSYNNKTKKFRKTPFILGILTLILATTSLWWEYVRKALDWSTPIVLGGLGLLIVLFSYNWTTKKFNKTTTTIGVIVTIVASSQYWIKYFGGIINPIISLFVKLIFWLGNLFDASNPALIGTIVFLTALALVIGGATYFTKQQVGGN